MKQNWTYKKLGEVCTIERGGSPRPIDEYITDDPNGLNWIKIGDAKEGSKFITSTKEKIKPEGLKKTRLVHKGDFILSNSMSFGKPYILDIDGCIHDGWLVIHDDNGTFDKSYLYYLLGSPNMYTEFQRLAVGGVVNNLNSEIVRNVVVPIPPLETQSQIVNELDLLQSIIDKQKAQLKELDNLAQAVFYDMFGDPVENEKGWEVKKLGDLLDSIRYGTSQPPFFSEVGYKFIRATNIKNGRVIEEGMKFIDDSEAQKLSKCKLSGGELIIVRSGVNAGDTCEITEEYVGQYAGYDIIVKLGDLLNSTFINSLINTRFMDVIVKPLTKRSAQPHINTEQVQSFPIILPPLSLQQSFAAKIEAIEKQKTAIGKSIEETQKLFDYTMDKYFG